MLQKIRCFDLISGWLLMVRGSLFSRFQQSTKKIERRTAIWLETNHKFLHYSENLPGKSVYKFFCFPQFLFAVQIKRKHAVEISISYMTNNWGWTKKDEQPINRSRFLPSQSEGEFLCIPEFFLVVRFYGNKTMEVPITHVPNNRGWKWTSAWNIKIILGEKNENVALFVQLAYRPHWSVMKTLCKQEEFENAGF